ncbi:MAG: PCMD domain-containing protein [Bacteroidales bacterium]
MNKFIKYQRLLLLLIVIQLLNSCIENDIPYPTILAQFITVVAEDESSAAVIDTQTQSVTLTLSEQVNIEDVKITSYSITEGATISEEIVGGIDLSSTVNVTLSLYQDYNWSIKASQNIERYFNITGQIGSSTIDPVSCTVLAYVPSSYNRRYLKVESIKLGAEGVSEMSPNLEGELVDFRTPVSVNVSAFGQTQQWIIQVDTTSSSVTTSSVDAWTNLIWAYGEAQADKDNGFEYKASEATDWIRVADTAIISDGGSFKACITNLNANSAYVVRAYSDEDYGDEVEVETAGYLEIPNASFDNWWKNGNIWNPWSEDGESFWDTGNEGSSTLGSSNSTPSEDTWNGGGGYSAELASKFVGIGIIGKAAAGSIFTGDFVAVDGTNGILSFGREFDGRPTKLKGYFKYNCSDINYTSTDYSYMMGEPDTASIYIALTDWSTPLEIRTNPSNRQLFDPKDSGVIAYGAVEYGYTVSNFTEFEIELDYNDTDRVPTYILIVASASKYGDYFTIGSSSTLYVDNFSLEWDY